MFAAFSTDKYIRLFWTGNMALKLCRCHDLSKSGLEISQNKICGGECGSCKFYRNKNTLLFSIDVIGSYLRLI